MVNVKAEPPALTKSGLRLQMAGRGGLMVKVAGADVPSAVATVMLPVPENSIKLAGTATNNFVGLMLIVLREVVPHDTVVASGAKAVPVMVNENPAPPALIEEGARLVMASGAGTIVKPNLFDQL